MDSEKFLLISDSHGHIPALKAVLTWTQNQSQSGNFISGAVFLGDGVSDLQPAAAAASFYGGWRIVRGNNDYDTSLPGSAIFEFADNRFFMCHGHRHALYGGYHSLISAARACDANAVLFGHTHTPCYKSENGVLLINPGSVSRPRSREGATFAVVECAQGSQPTAEFWGISDRFEIKKLDFINNKR